MLRKSLLLKILSITIAITIVGFIVLISKVLVEGEKGHLKEKAQTAELMGEPLLHTIYRDMLDERADMVRRLAEGMKTIEGVRRVQVIRESGEEAFMDFKTLKAVEEEYGKLKPEWTEGHPDATRLAEGIDDPNYKKFMEAFKAQNAKPFSYIETYNNERLFTYLTPIERRPKCKSCHVGDHARGVLMISLSLEDMYAAIAKQRLLWIFYGLATVIGIGVMLEFLVKRLVTNPIKDIVHMFRGISVSGDLTSRTEIKGDPGQEINELVSEFNVMARKLNDRTDEMKLMNKRLIELSVTDDLTQVFNYRYFYARLNEEVNRSIRNRREFSLVLMDIDDFKKYNDTYGHRQGDMILAKLAGLLKATLRKTDIIVRYGGEEFAAILPDTDKDNAAVMGERLRKAVAEAELMSMDGAPLGRITLSIGVATFLVDAKDGEELVKKVDAACYAAKEKGKNRVERA
ncbi:MAG: diguanylate cyclase [Thermodesulfobacteriota bacterium]